MTDGALTTAAFDTVGLRALWNRLQLGRVLKFADSNQGDVAMPQRIPDGEIHRANIVTSAYNTGEERHALLLDIDHPAWLVKSSTPGHYHLYIDVPGGIPHEDYMLLLTWLAKCNVIEEGYARTSNARGFTSLRFPWIKKEKTP